MKTGVLVALSVGVILCNVAMYGTVAWVLSSAITSGIKAGTDSCGKKYKAEDYGVYGDLFCDKKGSK